MGTLVSALGSTTSTAPSADGITVLVQDSTGFATGDRVAIGTGDTSLAQATSAGATTITVDSVSGFSVGQLIVIDGVQDAFGLGFKSGFETSTIASINTTSSAITLTAALTKSHAAGTGATGIEYGRIESVSGNVLTLADALTVATPSGTPVAEKPKLADILQAIFHFTGGLSVGAGSTQGVFQQFIPGVGGDLTILRQGLAYWFLADQTAFAKSAPLPGFTEGPVIPVTMQLDGVFFDATGNPPSLPATITLSKAGWHQSADLGAEPHRGTRRPRSDRQRRSAVYLPGRVPEVHPVRLDGSRGRDRGRRLQPAVPR